MGGSAGEMASLAAIDLGTGKTAVAISAGEKHVCAILNDGTLKCWGNGWSGRVGYDLAGQNFGDVPGDMASLPTVDLGTDKTLWLSAVGGTTRVSF